MRLLAHTNIDFLGKRKIAGIISFSMILMGLVSLVLKGGPLLGIDFTGGTLAQLQFAVPTNVAEIRLVLLEKGFSRPTIQRFGSDNEMLIRMPAEETVQFSDRLKSALTDYEFTIRRLETVGPKIGEELKGKALWSVFYALLGILLYITIRFDRYYALGAVVALAHDVLITLGIFSLLNLEIDLAILAAFLTIVGYSLNDTIVVFDRIRENAKTQRRAEFYATVNRSVNQTLGRTVITSLTTLMVVTTLFLIGGEVIKYFAFAMIVGVIVGTYSSIYIAAPIVHNLMKWFPGKIQ